MISSNDDIIDKVNTNIIIIFNMLILHWMKNQFRYNFFTEDQTVQSSKF